MREQQQQTEAAEREVEQWRDRCEGAERRVGELERHLGARCLEGEDMARQLQAYMAAESQLFAQRETQSDELRRLRARVAALERDLARTHSELEDEAAAKFKLAQVLCVLYACRV